MTDKYFIPSVEDIRVGYECEIKHSAEIHSLSHTLGGKEWNLFKIKTDWDIWHSIHYLNHDCLRVPYLTKEQIEAEGLEFKLANDKGDRFGYQKNNYYMIWFPSKHEIEMIYRDPSIEDDYRIPEKFKFWCICKDINTFRYINKLLET